MNMSVVPEIHIGQFAKYVIVISVDSSMIEGQYEVAILDTTKEGKLDKLFLHDTTLDMLRSRLSNVSPIDTYILGMGVKDITGDHSARLWGTNKSTSINTTSIEKM